jgi:hypothetical protein
VLSEARKEEGKTSIIIPDETTKWNDGGGHSKIQSKSGKKGMDKKSQQQASIVYGEIL